jgi:hypothetical protein
MSTMIIPILHLSCNVSLLLFLICCQSTFGTSVLSYVKLHDLVVEQHDVCVWYTAQAALILIRHGESLWNSKNLFTGCVDVPLSEQGVNEAIEAGKRISDIPVDMIFTSALIRAQMTAMLAMTQHRRQKVQYLPFVCYISPLLLFHPLVVLLVLDFHSFCHTWDVLCLHPYFFLP